MTDTTALREIIAKSGLKMGYIAEQCGFSSPTTLYNKMFNRSEFTAPEIKRICDVLHITSLKERERIFFAK